MAALTPVPKIQFFAANGEPLVGGKLYSYAAGTTTPLVTYTDQAATSANTNPVILDSRGEASVWLGTGPYKLRLTTATDVDIWTVDDIYSEGAQSMQELLSASGSSLVGFIADGTGAQYRTVQSKLRDTVSVKDFGAVGDGTTDDTAAIQAALNTTSLATIYFPPGTYKVTGTGAACLTMTYNHSLIGDSSRTAVIRADSAGATTAILKIAITNNGGLLDVRNFRISNLGMFHNLGGQHGIVVDANAGLPMFSSVFEGLNITPNETNSGSAITATGGFAFNTIRDCTLNGQVVLDSVADGNRILDNVIFGTRPGVYLNIIEGAYETEVCGNTITNRDGQIWIANGSQILIDCNQLEQAQVYGPNTATYGAQVRITGLARACENIWITHNNFGGGANAANCLVLENAKDVRIDSNVFCGSGSATTNVDVLFTASCSYNYLEFSNQRGLSNGRSDKFRLTWTDLGTGNFGTLQQTQSSSSGGYNAGMNYYKDPRTEDIVLGASNGGSTAPGTVIVTLPTGFKPADAYTLPAATSAGVFVIGTNSTTGAVTCTTAAPSNSGVADGVRFPAKRG